MKILISGSNGFLGSNLTRTLINFGWHIDCLIHINQDRLEPLLYGINRIIHDIDKIDKDYDVVFVLNATIYPKVNELTELIDGNIAFIGEIIKRCGNSHIVFSSSISVYSPSMHKISEATPPNPINRYGISKLCAENIVRLSDSYTCIRFSSIIGKGMSTNTFIPTIIKNAKENGVINLYGNGERLQNYIPIEDAVDLCIKAAMQREGVLYLGVYPIEYTNLEIAKKVSKFIKGVEIKFSDVDTSPSWKFDNSYTRLNLNKHEFESIDNTLQRIIET